MMSQGSYRRPRIRCHRATIDGSQGATADIGLVLVRPGLDRERQFTLGSSV
jgi:hypothetical protein